MPIDLVPDNPITLMDESSSIKLFYESPKLSVFLTCNIENNEGFGSDAGLAVGAS